jgi:hypothetical protein
MRSRAPLLALTLFLALSLVPRVRSTMIAQISQASAAPAAAAGSSELVNGGFDLTGAAWLAPWSLGIAAPAVATVSQDSGPSAGLPYSARVAVPQGVPNAAWDAALYQSNVSLVAGTTYNLTFWAKAGAADTMQAVVQQTVSPWTARAKQWYTLTSSWQQFTLSYTAAVTESATKVQFNLAQTTNTVWIAGADFTASVSPASVIPTSTDVPPTAIATSTAVPPTATAISTSVPPTATATSTAVPPTATAISTSVPPTAIATSTSVPPTATPVPSATAITVSLAGSAQAFPRLGNLNAFRKGAQAGTFSRYGLVVAPLSAGSGISALKAPGTGTKAVFYFNTSSVAASGFDGLNIYPRWWLTLAGTSLSAAINATTTTIPVASAAVINNYISTNRDVLVDGESMHVTAVNTAANTLTVQRGYYSTATTHSAGARLAAHASKWANAWMLNVTPYCPTNPATGQTWDQYAAQQVRADFGGAAWDGVFFDDANNSFTQVSNGQLDANNDNVADGGNGPSGSGWNDGETTLFSLTHAAAPSALLVANGGYYPALSSGREMEHFPYYDNGWASGFNHYLMMAAPGASAPYTLLNADTSNTGTQNLQTMRFNLGTTLMGNGYYAYDYGTQAHGQTWWYDEFDNGAGSSLTSQISSSQTTLPLAGGTGSRFKVGDVVRVPESLYNPAQAGALDDEQMLVRAVSGDTLTVQRGYNGTVAAWHPALTKVLTQAQIAGGQGWLGQPLGSAAQVALTTSSELANGGFDAGLSPWVLGVSSPAAASVAADTSTAVDGGASARITVTNPAPSAGWDVALQQQNFSLVAGNSYTISFYAKSSTGQTISVSVQRAVSPWTTRTSQYFTLTNTWQRYTAAFTAPATESAVKLTFNVGSSAGTVWLDGTSLQRGDSNLWRRDFSNGTVLLNATNAPVTVNLGSGYRRIQGTQDRVTNSGAAVSSVTVPAQDAVLLVKTS